MMIDMTVELINTLGFPIMMVLLLYYNNHKMTQQYSELTTRVTDVVEKNNIINTELILKINEMRNTYNDKDRQNK